MVPLTEMESQFWGHSSFGRAGALQASGGRFDPGWFHHRRLPEVRRMCCDSRIQALLEIQGHISLSVIERFGRRSCVVSNETPGKS